MTTICKDCGVTGKGVHHCEEVQFLQKGKAMPQTVAQWRYLYGLAEKRMLKDKERIAQLKCELNTTKQKLDSLKRKMEAHDE